MSQHKNIKRKIPNAKFYLKIKCYCIKLYYRPVKITGR